MSGGGFDPTLPPLPINGNDDVCPNPPQYTQQHHQQPTTTKSTVARKRRKRKNVLELSDDMTKMPQGYTPKGNDVIIGRGNQQYNSPGYSNYRDLIAQNKSRYQTAEKRTGDKMAIAQDVVKQLREMNPPV